MEGCKAACRPTSCLKYWYTQDLRGVLYKFSLQMFPVHLTAFAVKSNTVWALLMISGQRCSSNIHIDPCSRLSCCPVFLRERWCSSWRSPGSLTVSFNLKYLCFASLHLFPIQQMHHLIQTSGLASGCIIDELYVYPASLMLRCASSPLPSNI